MDDFSHIINYYERFYGRPISAAEREFITSSFRKETFIKKESIFSSGQKNTRHYFIEKGLLRLYVIDSNGKEFNVLFACENQWIGDLATPEETVFFLDAVEKTTVFSISDEKLSVLTDDFSSFVKYIKRSYIFLQKRLVSILVNSAEENYDELLNQYPNLVRRLPQYHISSYLGVTPVFLSKIRSGKTRKRQ